MPTVVLPLLVGGPIATAQGTAGDVDFHLERVSGPSRYGTAAPASRRFFATGAPVAFVVTSADFPDGLVGGTTAVSEAVRQALESLTGGDVVRVFGPTSPPAEPSRTR